MLIAYLFKNQISVWSSIHNLNWLQEIINIRTLNTIYIAHPKINQALKRAAQIELNLTTFNNNYRGNRNASYVEATILIFAGFVNFEDTEIPIVGNNFAGKRTR